MRKSAMTPDALPHRGTAAPFRVAIGLALAASASVMLWGVSAHGVSASEFGPNVARETPMTLEDRVAALTAELAHVKIETAKLRESQNDTSEELSHVRASLANAEMGFAALRTATDENEAHRRYTAAQVASNLAQLKDETLHLRMAQDDTATEIGSLRAGVAKSQNDTSEELSHVRASLANAEMGLSALRTTTDENEAHRRDTAAQVASNLAQLKDETLHLRMAQDDTATEIGSLRAGVANSEIGLDSLRATTGEIRRQIERIDNATGSIAKSHKPNGHRKWVAQR